MLDVQGAVGAGGAGGGEVWVASYVAADGVELAAEEWVRLIGVEPGGRCGGRSGERPGQDMEGLVVEGSGLAREGIACGGRDDGGQDEEGGAWGESQEEVWWDHGVLDSWRCLL